MNSLGMHHSVAHDGKEAVEMASQHCFDLILMDIIMPEMDGLAATIKIREYSKSKTMPIILAMTAGTSEYDWENCKKSGMNGFIQKPLSYEKLKEAIDNYFS